MLKFLILSVALVCAVQGKKSKKGKKGGGLDCGMDAKIDDALESPTKLQELYEEYKAEHCVDHPEQQHTQRLEIFRKQLVTLQEMKKSKSVSWTVGITHLAHLTECEKQLFHGHNTTKHFGDEECDGYRPPDSLQGARPSGEEKLDPTWDWRTLGAVTPVKDKISDMTTGWAHAAVVPLEAAIFKRTGELHELSVQELVDCTYKGVHHSIDKEEGSVRDAWEYIMGMHRIGYARDLPETGTYGACDERITDAPNAFEKFHLVEERRLPMGDHNDYHITFAVRKHGPVVVSMWAANAKLDTYKGGAYNPPSNCDDSFEHAMAIVGYVPEYWIIKNSWGTSWGDNGYMWWVRKGGHNCNILKKAYIPIIKERETKDPSEGDHY